jgi:hypothetical protein
VLCRQSILVAIPLEIGPGGILERVRLAMLHGELPELATGAKWLEKISSIAKFRPMMYKLRA